MGRGKEYGGGGEAGRGKENSLNSGTRKKISSPLSCLFFAYRIFGKYRERSSRRCFSSPLRNYRREAAKLDRIDSCSLRRRNLTSIIAGKNAAAAVVGRKKKIASSLAQKERGRSFLRDVKRYAHFGPLFFFLLLLKPSSFSLFPPLMSPRLPPPPYFPTTNYVEIKLVETSPFLALLANTTRTRCCCCLLNPAALWRFLRLQRE